MDELDHYGDLIKKILTEYYEWASQATQAAGGVAVSNLLKCAT